MPFPFTFSLSVPGIANPFASEANAQGTHTVQSEQVPTSKGRFEPISSVTGVRHERVGPRRRASVSPAPSVSTSSSALNSRKRGWEPAISQPSLATTTTATSNLGYLDTPARYRDMASDNDFSRSREHLEREIEDMAAGRSIHYPITLTSSSPFRDRAGGHMSYTMHVLSSCAHLHFA